MLENFIYIFLGGGSGSFTRYLISLFFKKYYLNFPVGTLLVNLLGSFLIGFFFVFLDKKIYMKEFFLIGFLGGLTTFSTFSYESILLIKEARWISFFAYTTLNILCGFGLTFIGYEWGSSLKT